MKVSISKTKEPKANIQLDQDELLLLLNCLRFPLVPAVDLNEYINLSNGFKDIHHALWERIAANNVKAAEAKDEDR